MPLSSASTDRPDREGRPGQGRSRRSRTAYQADPCRGQVVSGRRLRRVLVHIGHCAGAVANRDAKALSAEPASKRDGRSDRGADMSTNVSSVPRSSIAGSRARRAGAARCATSSSACPRTLRRRIIFMTWSDPLQTFRPAATMSGVRCDRTLLANRLDWRLCAHLGN